MGIDINLTHGVAL